MLLPRYYFSDEFSQFESRLLECGGIRESFPKGEYLCGPGNMLRDGYVILDGIARLSVMTDVGKNLTIGFWGKGSYFPIIVSEQQFTLEPYFNFVAMTDLETIAIAPEGVCMACERYPDFSIAVINHYCKFANLLLVRNILSAESTSMSKVCNFLYLYWYNSEEHNPVIALSHDEIASITGLTRVQVTRVLSFLRDEKTIETSRGKVRILDIEGLQRHCLDLVNVDSSTSGQ